MSDQITSFDPNIPKEEVDRLFRKLADTRLPRFLWSLTPAMTMVPLLKLFHRSDVDIW